MLPDAQGGFRIAEAWRWPDALDPEAFGGEAALSLRCAFMLQETQHIVDLDALRRGGGQMAEDLAIPAWLLSEERAWVVVLLLHFQRMIAAAVLQRPAAARALDWEDLDVLRSAGRQAASYLAEPHRQAGSGEPGAGNRCGATWNERGG